MKENFEKMAAVFESVLNSWKSRFGVGNGGEISKSFKSCLPIDRTKMNFRQRNIEALNMTFVEEWFVRGKTFKLNVYILASARQAKKYKFEIEIQDHRFSGDVFSLDDQTSNQNTVVDSNGMLENFLNENSTFQYTLTIKKC